jgi:hypothetical protein
MFSLSSPGRARLMIYFSASSFIFMEGAASGAVALFAGTGSDRSCVYINLFLSVVIADYL